ncbi:MAG TPA: heparinase II/III family protein, partial [Stellaceae bacterium]|nr:heparinase II/III family protein [Stellaceae bacterium]
MPSAADAQVVEVRADAPLRQLFRTGANATRLSSIAIWFSGWSPDWTPQKSLVMRVYAGQDLAHVLATAEEPYSRRLWEGAVHVFTFNLPVNPNANYTFELTTRGGVPLTGAALGQPPYGEGVGPLASNGETLNGALWFETVVKRRANLDQLYLDVFRHFDLNRADMRAVRAAVAIRDWDAAKRALVSHFESRADIFPLHRPGAALSPQGHSGGSSAPASAKSPSLAKGQQASDSPHALRPGAATVSARGGSVERNAVADADLIVEHEVRIGAEVVDLGPRWSQMAVWPARGGAEFRRVGLGGTLAAAYIATRDEKYARAWESMLRFQLADAPSPLRAGAVDPQASEIPPIGHDGIEGGSTWSAASIAERLDQAFTYYSAFRGSPSFSLDTRFAFI